MRNWPALPARTLPALALALTTACSSVPAVSSDGVIRIALGQTASVDGPRITPLKVLEDSRCPINARCIWAGRVRLQIKVTLGRGATIYEIETGKSLPIADGQLELVDVQPGNVAGGKPLAPGAYRFGFKFVGGI